MKEWAEWRSPRLFFNGRLEAPRHRLSGSDSGDGRQTGGDYLLLAIAQGEQIGAGHHLRNLHRAG